MSAAHFRRRILVAATLALGLLCACAATEQAALPAPTKVDVVQQEYAATPTQPDTATAGPLPTSTPNEPTPLPATTEVSGTETEVLLGSLPAPVSLETALYQGRYGRAIELWELGSLDVAQQGALALSVAHAYIAEQRPRDAIALLVQFAEANDDQDLDAAALGLLGTTYADLGEWQAAIEAYRRHLELTQAIAPQIQIEVAKAYDSLGEEQDALSTLESIELDSISAADRASILEDMAELQREAQAYDTALSLYNEILAFAQQSGYRALVQHYQAQTLVEADRLDEALSVWDSILRDTPESYSAILALDALDMHDAADIERLDRTTILLNAKRYDEAEQTLQAYIYAHTDESLARAYLLLGDVYTALKEYSSAFAAYDTVIGEYADSNFVGQAWMAKAAAEQAYGGDPTGLYFEFARLYPDHADADEALWLGGLYLERNHQWVRAEEFYQQVVERFADSDHAQESAFRQGLMHYAAGRYGQAQTLWAAGPDDEALAEEQARWLMWQGLAEDLAGLDPHPTWARAYAAGPTTYYGLRAQTLADEIQGSTPERSTLSLDAVDMTAEDLVELETWVSSWYTPTLGADVSAAIDNTVVRALLMDRMGWHAQAMRAMRDLYDSHKADPRAQTRIALACLEPGWYSPLILAANRARWLGLQADAPKAPDALWRLSYPVVYPHLIQTYTDHYELDPLLMLALMRQESRFDALAVSYAGAKGLAQVMPDTGAWVAERIGDDDFATSWLERPHVSISYGAWFLRWLLDLYDDDEVAALAAYNAGPGNVNRWTSEEPIVDRDLFIETLPIQQPQDYVTWISIQYSIYERLYTSP